MGYLDSRWVDAGMASEQVGVCPGDDSVMERRDIHLGGGGRPLVLAVAA